MSLSKREMGFTLIEVLAVIIIMGILAAVVIPKVTASTENSRKKADVATGHVVKAALDRLQLETGVYPKTTELTVSSGTVTCANLIPKYISKLDQTTSQQIVADANKGFGVAELTANASDSTQYSIPNTESASNIIMIYLTSNGMAGEVRVYDANLVKVLWTSAN